MNNKVIVCDLDGTLAPSKSALEKSMAEIICRVLEKHRFAVISGGSYQQFQKQFLSGLFCGGEILVNLYLFPTNGSSCYVFDKKINDWNNLYDEKMTQVERDKIIAGFKKAILESGVDVSNPYGELIEDRGGQVTFSGRGQEAPLSEKEIWDPDQSKRKKIVQILEKEISGFEIRIGGATSIDVTHLGIDKAYAIKKIEELLKIDKKDIIFFGDAIFPGGNDYAAKEAGVESILVKDPKETESYLLKLINTIG